DVVDGPAAVTFARARLNLHESLQLAFPPEAGRDDATTVRAGRAAGVAQIRTHRDTAGDRRDRKARHRGALVDPVLRLPERGVVDLDHLGVDPAPELPLRHRADPVALRPAVPPETRAAMAGGEDRRRAVGGLHVEADRAERDVAVVQVVPDLDPAADRRRALEARARERLDVGRVHGDVQGGPIRVAQIRDHVLDLRVERIRHAQLHGVRRRHDERARLVRLDGDRRHARVDVVRDGVERRHAPSYGYLLDEAVRQPELRGEPGGDPRLRRRDL